MKERRLSTLSLEELERKGTMRDENEGLHRGNTGKRFNDGKDVRK
jgi:hypothetical protein